MSAKCTSCGANLSDHDESCSYCGTINPGYRPLENEVNFLMEEAADAFQKEQYAMAVNYYKQAIALDPEIFEAYFYLAAGYVQLKRTDEAIKAMEKAREMRPQNAPIYYNLGTLCKKIGRKDEARKYLEQALALVKADPMANKEFLQNIEKQLAEFKRWKLF